MIDFELTATETRILGCLIEKEMTTPEYYPLSMNALINACNQKSNRNPVVSYDEETVRQGLEDLKAIQLAWQSDTARVSKFEHLLAKKFNLIARELAILCVLMLRGPQTLGELRTRTDRMYGFADMDEIGETISGLEEMGLVRQMPRQPGQKENRFVQLLSGAPAAAAAAVDETSAGVQVAGRMDRIAALEEDVRSLQEQLADLQKEFLEFRRQFE